ncbi:MAG: nucleotide-binding protein [bacterium]|nr:nucleotide-binding protein [bacterium]
MSTRTSERAFRVFIGSSSEQIGAARALQTTMEKLSVGESVIECVLWDQSFLEPSLTTIETLDSKLTTAFDLAVFFFGPDDWVARRGKKARITRANVVIKTGLGIGRLGRIRTLVVRPKDVPDLVFPSDLLGVTVLAYDEERARREPEPALSAVASRIAEYASRLEPREVLLIPPLQEVEIAAFYSQTGLTTAWPKRTEAASAILTDVGQARKSVAMYARVYISEVLKDTSGFSKAILQAADQGSKSGGPRESLTIRHVSVGADDRSGLAKLVWKQEDPQGKRWPTLARYKKHLKDSDVFFDAVFRKVQRMVGSSPSARRKSIQFDRRCLADFPLSHSLVVIDDRIVYVSFYSMSGSRYGTFAPTMRLEATLEADNWARHFIEGAHRIDRKHSRCRPEYDLIR